MKPHERAVSKTLTFLAGLPLFAELGESALRALAAECTFRQLEKGEVLFLQHGPADAAYLVRAGRVSMVLNSPDGREMVINEMQPGDLFGELGILTKKSHSAGAVAQTKAEVLTIPHRAFLNLIQHQPQVTLRLLEITADRLHISGARESALAFLGAQARLARLLLELAGQEAEKGYITISQEELANRTGLIRQTVARVLGRWRRAGWLITGRGNILIVNREALEELERQLWM